MEKKRFFGGNQALWSDPIDWAEKTVGTKKSMFFMILSHFVLLIFGLGIIYWTSELMRQLFPYGNLYAFIIGGFSLLFASVLLPSMNLYALYRLLKILKKKSKNNNLSDFKDCKD